MANFVGAFHDLMLFAELTGALPEVPIYEDIDIKELTNGEQNPVFITLPIGRAGAISGNRRYYDEEFVRELERQVTANKPIGLMGHLPTDQRGFAFPTEAVHWIGTMRVNEYLFGKGYLPEGEARTRMQRYKATNKKIATSIDASGEGIWDESRKAHRMIAETLKLNQIDIAPADRAGIPDLSAVPLLTAEMDGNPLLVTSNVYTVVGEKKKMTEEEKAQAIRELRSSDAAALPKDVRDAIILEYATEMKTALGLDGDIVEAVRKIRDRDEAREKAAITARITELASTGDKAVKLEAVREMVVELVTARNPKTLAEVDTIYGEVVEKDSVKKALQMTVQETMGPNQTSPIQKQTTTKPGAVPSMKGNWFVVTEVKE